MHKRFFFDNSQTLQRTLLPIYKATRLAYTSL